MLTLKNESGNPTFCIILYNCKKLITLLTVSETSFVSDNKVNNFIWFFYKNIPSWMRQKVDLTLIYLVMLYNT